MSNSGVTYIGLDQIPVLRMRMIRIRMRSVTAEGDDGIDDDPVLWNVKAPKGSNLVGFISLKSL